MMCGIIGYIGNKNANEIIKEGLIRLEYRGYDSSGVAIIEKKLNVFKDVGTIEKIYEKYKISPYKGNIAIGHTRWATHGKICKENAHPFFDCKKEIAIVHNGTLTNYNELKEKLKNHKFESETDSEIIAHLIEEEGGGWKGFKKAIEKIKGSYAILAIDVNEKKLFFAKKDSPLVIGVGNGFYFSSDINAISNYTNRFIFLNDNEYGFSDGEKIKIFYKREEIKKEIKEVNIPKNTSIKGNFEYFMRKEIEDQIEVVKKTEDIDIDEKNLDIVACGTSYHAGYILSILLEKYKGIRTKCYIASEFPSIADPKNTILAISQSGETSDTIKAVKFAKEKKCKIISIINNYNTSLSRLSDKVYHINAGLEIGVAATKTFMNQLVMFYRSVFQIEKEKISEFIKNAIKKEDEIKEIVKLNFKKYFFIGRGLSYGIAMEGALKFKEITYLQAEAYPAGELKHGPLSIVDKDTCVFVVGNDDIEKLKGNIEEIKSRGAFIVSLTNNKEIKNLSNKYIESNNIFESTVILQLLAYHKCLLFGYNPDKPRNLAKSVTVE